MVLGIGKGWSELKFNGVGRLSCIEKTTLEKKSKDLP